MILKNKKGSLDTILVIGLIVFTLSLLGLIGFKIMGELNTEFQANDNFDTYGKDASNYMNSFYSGTFDNGMLFLVVGMGVVMLILAALVKIHPVFIPIFFIGLLIFIFLSGVLANVYDDIASTTAFSEQADQLTFTSFIMTRLPIILSVFGVILMVVMYKTSGYVNI